MPIAQKLNWKRWPVLRRGPDFQALVPVCLIAAGLSAYGNSLAGPFVYDDTPSIVQNQTIRRLWPPWSALRPLHGLGLTVEGRPVLNLSLAVNYAISGTNVWSYHALNLLIHISAGLALFGIARRTLELSERIRVRENADADRTLTSGGLSRSALGTATRQGSSTLIAFAIALLWTVHPLQTEAVTYVIQRAESLMGLFYLLTLYCFLRGGALGAGQVADLACRSHRRERAIWYSLSVLCCFLGMGTKEVMASAPLVIFIFDRTFLAGSFRRAWRMRRSYYGALASSWVLLAALIAAGGGNRSGSVGFGVSTSWSGYLLTQFPAIVRYLSLVFWPHPLVFEYGTFWVDHPFQVLPQALLVLSLLGGSVWAMRFRPAVGFLGACFFLILAPTSLAPGTSQMIVEHRMYLPLAALLGLVVPAVYAAVGRRRALFAIAVTAAGVALGAATVRRNAAYATAIDIWSDTVAERPRNVEARNGLAIALNSAGRTQEAIADLEEALRIKPAEAETHNNLGFALNKSGRTEEAIAEYETALRLRPDYEQAQNNLGNALGRMGRTREAIAELEAALRFHPDFIEAHNNLGNALKQAGRLPEAIAQYEAALRLDPGFVEAHHNLGRALDRIGKTEEAIVQYREALRGLSGNADAALLLGDALQRVGRIDEAIAAYRQALLIRPDSPEICADLGLALAREGQLTEALAQLSEAVRLRPDFAKARAFYGLTLAQSGRWSEAAEQYREALRVGPNRPEVHYQLALALQALGKTAEAKAEFKAAGPHEP